MLSVEMMQHCREKILPYWMNLKDEKYGGYYGMVDFELQIDKKAEKGVILNSRILWFFANAYLLTKDEKIKLHMEHAYRFLKEKCVDREYGGVFWMLNYDGSTKETMKHTYNQAFAIYALSAYYEATNNSEALNLALDLFSHIEEKCVDAYGYKEAFDRQWQLINNEKLSENGVNASKTMNTLLHLLEAYTELYKVSGNLRVKERLIYILDLFKQKVYNSKEKRLEVFFDEKMNSIADLHSYGHDIEASWLLDRAADILGVDDIKRWVNQMTAVLNEEIYKKAFVDGQSVNNEMFNGVVNETKVWWVQAESVVGFYNAFQHSGNHTYYVAAEQVWNYIKEFFVDTRDGGEWFWDLTKEGIPKSKKPITEPWKCPYHNGRMCFEIYRRESNVQ